MLLIAIDNIKKKKINALILLVLVAISMTMLYVGTSVIKNMSASIAKGKEQTNGADVFFYCEEKYADQICGFIEEQPQTTLIETEEAMYISGSKLYKEYETVDDSTAIGCIFADMEQAREISKAVLLEEGTQWKKNSIVLPYYVKAGMGYQVGDKLMIAYGKEVYEFEIYGFIEDIMFPNLTCINAEIAYIDSAYYQELKEAWKVRGEMIKVDLQDGADTSEFENCITGLAEEEWGDTAITWALNADTMGYASGIMANILMSILTVFSIVLLGISLIIMRFTINNAIEMNISNIGILEAVGYTTKQLRLSMVLEYGMISILGCILGAGTSLIFAKKIGTIIAISVGFTWKIGYDLICLLGSGIGIVLVIIVGVLLSTRTVAGISPLMAMRNGIHVHNFRKNVMPLDASVLPLNIAIGIKNIVSQRGRSIAICVIVIVLSFCANMSLGLNHHFSEDRTNLLQIIGLEKPDVYMDANSLITEDTDAKSAMIAYKDIRSKVAENDKVMNYAERYETVVQCKNNKDTVTVNCNCFSTFEKMNINNLVEGRYPELANEITLNSAVMKELDMKIGDMVGVESNGKEANYIVVGVTQGMSYLGKTAYITNEGIGHIVDLTEWIPLLYLYCEEADIQDVIADIQGYSANNRITVEAGSKSVDYMIESLEMAMKILCGVMLSMAIVVIAMILVLIIRTQINQNQQQIGIYKAIGYTTPQLIIQMLTNYMPTLVVGTALGCVASALWVNKFVLLCLSLFDIRKCSMGPSAGHMVFVMLGVTVWSIIMILLSSAKIRVITPYKMIHEV